MRIKLTPTGWRGWSGLALWLAVLALPILAGLIYSFHMPGKSHSGPLPPLSAEETQIRDRLCAHVRMLAGSIGERNLWHYPFPLRWFYPDTANFIGFVGNCGSRKLVHSALRSFREHASFPAEGAAVPERIPGVGWSDHWSFWQAGYRAIMVTDTTFYRYAHYLRGEIPRTKVDYERTAHIASRLARVIADLAGRANGSGS